MGVLEASDQKRYLSPILILLVAGYFAMPSLAQSSKSGEPLTRRRPIMRKHTLSVYFERNYFKRVEQAASNLDPATVSTLYARSRLHIRRGNTSTSAGTPAATVPTVKTDHPTLYARQRALTGRTTTKKKTLPVQPGLSDLQSIQSIQSTEQATVQAGLPDNILTPITPP